MSLIDDFESSFQACLAPIHNPTSSHVFENDELKANMDTFQRFLDISQQIESFFTQKRAIIFDQKPESALAEEINEMKIELNRKETLLSRYYEKLARWSIHLNDALAGKPIVTPPQPITGPAGPMAPGQMGQMRMATVPQPAPVGASGPMTPTGPGSVGSPAMMHAPSPMMRPPNHGMVGSPMSGPMPMPPHQPGPPVAPPFNQMANVQTQGGGGLQGPLAYLERTTAHIGMSDNRR